MRDDTADLAAWERTVAEVTADDAATEPTIEELILGTPDHGPVSRPPWALDEPYE